MKRILTILLILVSSKLSGLTTIHVEYTSVPKSKNCEKPLRVAIIDTGFGIGWPGEESVHLCKYGHKNFTNTLDSTRFNTVDPIPTDNHSHGTHIAGIINSYAKGNYCLIILKYYDPLNINGDNLKNLIKAIEYAKNIGVDVINFSGGGPSKSEEEKKVIKEYLDKGGVFIAAAGNEHSNLKEHHYYPAEDDDRVIVVGNGINQKLREPSSNWGTRVNRWENGRDVMVFGHYMTGTSQAAAIATGKIVADKTICK